jgi:OFA family oxalate/formate antiporter-like MFS transporter
LHFTEHLLFSRTCISTLARYLFFYEVLVTESIQHKQKGNPSMPKPNSFRWFQLAVGVIAMVATANLQYGWTLFVRPIADKFHWSEAAIQVAFTLFILAQTWLVPLVAYMTDRFGPRVMVAGGGVFVGLAWCINSVADSLTLLYIGGIAGGIGAGIVYTTSVGSALKWFPDRRGLAAGITAAAYGAGAAITVVPISNMIKNSGYEQAFLVFGIAQGIIILVASLLLQVPTAADVPKVAESEAMMLKQSSQDCSPQEMIRTPIFWVLYAMFTTVATGGLLAVAQMGPVAKSFGVADTQVSLIGITMAALPFALSLDRILNGITRPFFGWVSDIIGREKTMFIAFTLEGFAIMLLLRFANDPILFVMLTALTFFAWGEIYSLFPAISGDLFGRKYATTNYALLYTAKGVASLLVPIGSVLKAATGSWEPIFYVAIAFDFIAALLALFVLRPLSVKWLAKAAVKTQAETDAKSAAATAKV